MLQKVINFIEKHHMLEENDQVVVGVSGGADSVCLLMLLHEFRKIMPITLFVVHINHKIRKEAGEDARYVRLLCERLEVPYFLVEENVEQIAKRDKVSTEEAGRIVRYQAFFNVIEQHTGGKGKIAVAHNLGDCAETMMFHLFRGSGLAGLSGIVPVRDQIIRPILCLSREEIEGYLKKQKIDWCIDSTNKENTYTRNKIRNVVLPYAEKEICKGATTHVAKAAENILEVREYIQGQREKAMEQVVSWKDEQVMIGVESFSQLPLFMQKQVLLRCFHYFENGQKDITANHINSILSLFEKQGCKEIHLPYQLIAIKEYETVILKKTDRTKDQLEEDGGIVEEVVLSISTETAIKSLGMVNTRSFFNENIENIPQNIYTKWFDCDRIINPLVFRMRRSGDFLTINESGQKKSLKEYMIQEKIPKSKRNTIWVLADGQHILWIPGYRISAYYKVSKLTKKILEITIRE